MRSVIFFVFFFIYGIFAPQQAEAQEVGSDALPPNFQGQIVYRGSYEGVARTNYDLKFGGQYEITINFATNGSVSGHSIMTEKINWRSGNPYGFRDTFSGTRQGTHCRLTWSDGSQENHYCGRQYHSVDFDQYPTPHAFVVWARYRASSTRFVNNTPRPIPPTYSALPTPALNGNWDQIAHQFNTIISADSQTWSMNRFTRGSVYDLKIASLSLDGRSMTVRGNYLYGFMSPGRSVGWLELKITDGKANCLRYHDFSNTCRPVGSSSPGNRNAAIALAGAALAIIAVSSSGESKGKGRARPATYTYTDPKAAERRRRAEVEAMLQAEGK